MKTRTLEACVPRRLSIGAAIRDVRLPTGIQLETMHSIQMIGHVALLISKCNQWIHARRAPRRQITGNSSDSQ
jgi:hypothetical protein